MDANEQRLIDAYESAVAKLTRTPKGTPESVAATAAVTVALRKLRAYQHRAKN